MSAGAEPTFPRIFLSEFQRLSALGDPAPRTKILDLMTMFHSGLKDEHPSKRKELDDALRIFQEVDANARNRKYQFAYKDVEELLSMYGGAIYNMFDKNDAYLLSKFHTAQMIASAPVVPTSSIAAFAPPAVAYAPAAAAAAVAAAPAVGTFYTNLKEEEGKRSVAGFKQLLTDFHNNVRTIFLLPSTHIAKNKATLAELKLSTLATLVEHYKVAKTDSERDLVLQNYATGLKELSEKVVNDLGLPIVDYYKYTGILVNTLYPSKNVAKRHATLKYAGGKRHKRRVTRRWRTLKKF